MPAADTESAILVIKRDRVALVAVSNRTVVVVGIGLCPGKPPDLLPAIGNVVLVVVLGYVERFTGATMDVSGHRRSIGERGNDLQRGIAAPVVGVEPYLEVGQVLPRGLGLLAVAVGYLDQRVFL